MFASRTNLQIIYTFNVKVQIFRNRSIFTTKSAKRSVAKTPFYVPIIFFVWHHWRNIFFHSSTIRTKYPCCLNGNNLTLSQVHSKRKVTTILVRINICCCCLCCSEQPTSFCDRPYIFSTSLHVSVYDCSDLISKKRGNVN